MALRRATPVLEAPRLAERLGATAEGGGLYVKDEGRLPTGSFKARGLVMAVSMAKEMGVKVRFPARRERDFRPWRCQKQKASTVRVQEVDRTAGRGLALDGMQSQTRAALIP